MPLERHLSPQSFSSLYNDEKANLGIKIGNEAFEKALITTSCQVNISITMDPADISEFHESSAHLSSAGYCDAQIYTPTNLPPPNDHRAKRVITTKDLSSLHVPD